MDRLDGVDRHDMLAHALATCHSIACSPRNPAELVGDTMEIQLLELSRWSLSGSAPSTLGLPDGEFTVSYPPRTHSKSASPALFDADGTVFVSLDTPHDCSLLSESGPPYPGRVQLNETDCLVVLRDFPFSSSMMRSTVIVGAVRQGSPDALLAFSKGSPEMIRTLCTAASLPADYDARVQAYARSGYRVLAIAGARLPAGPWAEVRRTFFAFWRFFFFTMR
jgi:magnesium-transporting ATPase (P-type)